MSAFPQNAIERNQAQPLGYRSVLAQLRRVWGCFFARENARLKLARLALVAGAGHRTHAARGLNRAQQHAAACAPRR